MLSKKKKELLCKFQDMKCEICRKLNKAVPLKLEELDIHRIKAGYEGGDYSNHRSLMVICKNHHKIITSAQRKSLMIQA